MPRFLTRGPILALFAMTVCTTGSSRAASQSKIVIDEGERPGRVFREYGGVCAGNDFRISIWPGRPVGDALRGLSVNGRSYLSRARTTLRARATIAGEVIDVTIHRCQDGRAQIRLDVSDPANRSQLRFFYLFTDASGRISLIGEK